MGQYHILANVDRREMVDPHLLGFGLKLVEQTGFIAPMPEVLWPLLVCSNGRGGGDYPDEWDPTGEVFGRWAGDRIVVLGDYTEEDDPIVVKLKGIMTYEELKAARYANPIDGSPHRRAALLMAGEEEFGRFGWKDISLLVLPVYEQVAGVKILDSPQGWKDRRLVGA